RARPDGPDSGVKSGPRGSLNESPAPRPAARGRFHAMKLLSILFVTWTAALGFGFAVRGTSAPSAGGPQPAADAFHAGSEHALLQKLVGTWDAVLVATDPSGKEVRTHGTLTTTRHTDFFTLDQFQGECMGQPFLGHGVNGYCTARKKYFTFWTDSLTS